MAAFFRTEWKYTFAFARISIMITTVFRLPMTDLQQLLWKLCYDVVMYHVAISF